MTVRQFHRWRMAPGGHNRQARSPPSIRRRRRRCRHSTLYRRWTMSCTRARRAVAPRSRSARCLTRASASRGSSTATPRGSRPPPMPSSSSRTRNGLPRHAASSHRRASAHHQSAASRRRRGSRSIVCRATIDTKLNIRIALRAARWSWWCSDRTTFVRVQPIAGGDFVAAVAAGNPVIGKANNGHPGTSRLMAEIAFDAAQANGLPPPLWADDLSGPRMSGLRSCRTLVLPPRDLPAARKRTRACS